ncbi:MAG: DNA adenine methylase [Anaerovoracaceae bacterium]
MANTTNVLSPVLKWVGGKRQLLDNIVPQIPKYSTYCEPFIGGGAVLFAEQPKKAIINDSNEELINVYRVIKESPEALIQKLSQHKKENCEQYFYHIRALDRQPEYRQLSDMERAARILYLNKTCFNGLFRVNSSGEFNSPWGKYKNPNITNEESILAMSKYLNKKNIKILCGDYKKALKGLRKGAFVYLDPPYMPISSTSSFTGYTVGGFAGEEQEVLKQQCDLLNKKGIKFLLSNSSCDFIEDLYRDYIIEKVSAKRVVNARSDRRGAVSEVLVRNYEID